jgi:hypothetical protein
MVSSLWSSEINKMIQRIVPVSPDIPPKVPPDITPKVSPDITPKKGSPIPAFCLTCGTKFVDGSVFCNKCGSKIIYPVHPLPPVQEDNTPVQGDDTPVKGYKTLVRGDEIPVKGYNTPVRGDDIIKNEVITPEISTGKIELPPKKIPVSDANNSDTQEKVPLIASLPKEEPKKKSFFAGSDKRKPAIIVVSALVCIILVIAVFLVVLPSVSPGFNLTFPGMNFTVPESNDIASDNNPLADTTPISETNGAPEIPEQTPVPEVPSAQPSFTSVPGDPSSVLVSYPSLFNAADGAGLSALLSENMKLYSSEVNSELATARSNGYSIEKIQVTNQIIEEDSAILDVAISWKVAGSPVTSSPKFFLVYENNQWKLDSLVVNPYVN